MVIEVQAPRSTSNAFHRAGAQTLEALKPYFFSRYIVDLNKNLSADLKFLAGIYGTIRSLKYSGARPLTALIAYNKILKVMRCSKLVSDYHEEFVFMYL